MLVLALKVLLSGSKNYFLRRNDAQEPKLHRCFDRCFEVLLFCCCYIPVAYLLADHCNLAYMFCPILYIPVVFLHYFSVVAAAEVLHYFSAVAVEELHYFSAAVVAEYLPLFSEFGFSDPEPCWQDSVR